MEVSIKVYSFQFPLRKFGLNRLGEWSPSLFHDSLHWSPDANLRTWFHSVNLDLHISWAIHIIKLNNMSQKAVRILLIWTSVVLPCVVLLASLYDFFWKFMWQDIGHCTSILHKCHSLSMCKSHSFRSNASSPKQNNWGCSRSPVAQLHLHGRIGGIVCFASGVLLAFLRKCYVVSTWCLAPTWKLVKFFPIFCEMRHCISSRLKVLETKQDKTSKIWRHAMGMLNVWSVDWIYQIRFLLSFLELELPQNKELIWGI